MSFEATLQRETRVRATLTSPTFQDGAVFGKGLGKAASPASCRDENAGYAVEQDDAISGHENDIEPGSPIGAGRRHRYRHDSHDDGEKIMEEEKYLTVDETCALLGLKSRQALYAMTHDGKIPHYKMLGERGRLRFKLSELHTWMQGFKVPVSESAADICKEVQL